MEVLLNQEAELNKESGNQDAAKMAVYEEMIKAGLALGKNNSRTFPRMKPFIFGSRNKIAIIDLEATEKFLEEAMNFVKKIVSEKGTVLLVGSSPVAKGSVQNVAEKLGLPFVTERWLGGTLTNFKTLSKRISYFKKLKSDKESGRLDKYTKKERLEFDRQIKKMTTMFNGIENLDNLPNAVFIVDVSKHLIAVREAKILKIPMVGVLNTDTDPALVAYPIPANDRGKSSVDWILARLEKAVQEGKNLSQQPAAN